VTVGRFGSVRVKEAVGIYQAEQKDKLDSWALKMLARLSDDPGAARAFERLKLSDRKQECTFLTVCVVVEQLARKFPAFILAEQRMPLRLNGLEKAVTNLRSFVVEQTAPPAASDLLTVWLAGPTPTAVEAMTSGLNSISKLIQLRRLSADNIMGRLGATRKKHRPNAAIIAAIQNLADGIRGLTGQPHGREVTELACVILNRDLPEKTVTYALRTRKQPLWPLIIY
jgi:hypothetical protein